MHAFAYVHALNALTDRCIVCATGISLVAWQCSASASASVSASASASDTASASAPMSGGDAHSGGETQGGEAQDGEAHLRHLSASTGSHGSDDGSAGTHVHNEMAIYIYICIYVHMYIYTYMHQECMCTTRWRHS